MILATTTTIPTWFLTASLGLGAAGIGGLITVIGFFLKRLIQQIDRQETRLTKVERIIDRLVPGERAA